MSISSSLDPTHLRRYKDLAVLLMRYGRSDWAKAIGFDETVEGAATTEQGEAEAEQLAKDLEDLGPTFVKLGQLLSTRVDLLPLKYLEPLARLQDSVGGIPYEEVAEIVREELGIRISKAFSEFDPEPLASASLGQVHRATLRDGRQVAVKVQRPGIRSIVNNDLEALSNLGDLLDEHTEVGQQYGFADILESFRRSLLDELDYRVEAGHLTAMADTLEGFDELIVPELIDDYSTSRVLTMTYLPGKRVDALHPLARLDVDGKRLAEVLFRAYLHQVLVRGLFHADPHPGNVFLTDDGRLALIDFGMVGRIQPSMQLELLQLLLSVGEGDGEEAAAIARRIGTARGPVREERFRRQVFELVARQTEVHLENLEVGRVVMRVFSIAADNGLRVPPELTLLGKALLNLDHVGRCLDPEFNASRAVRRYALTLVGKRMAQEPSPYKLLSRALGTKAFVEELPHRINHVFDAFGDNRLTVEIQGVNPEPILEGFRSIANRVTSGLVLAALIVGATLLMRVETNFTIFGYPGFAMICFLGAAAGGFGLVSSILWSDWKDRRTGAKKP